MENEDEFQAWLKRQFKEYGWRAYREVSPINSNVRADLLVQHDNWGWIGIECKHMTSLRNGKKIGEALDQILYQYRGEEYPHGAGEVNLWAFCPWLEHEPERSVGIRQTVRELLCNFGVAIMWPDSSYSPTEMKIDFAYSSSETKIQLGDEAGENYGDIDRIKNMVAKKMRSHSRDLGMCQYDSSGHGCTAPAVETVTVGNYEVNLCEHHTRAVETARWESEKRLRENA